MFYKEIELNEKVLGALTLSVSVLNVYKNILEIKGTNIEEISSVTKILQDIIKDGSTDITENVNIPFCVGDMIVATDGREIKGGLQIPKETQENGFIYTIIDITDDHVYIKPMDVSGSLVVRKKDLSKNYTKVVKMYRFAYLNNGAIHISNGYYSDKKEFIEEYLREGVDAKIVTQLDFTETYFFYLGNKK